MGSLYTKGIRRMSTIGGFVGESLEDAVAREMDEQKLRYIPESMDNLISETHFSQKELKHLYSSFKQNCPSGYVSREQFVVIFRTFFSIHRYSDARAYAELVFNTFDDDNNGRISFSEFVRELSMFTRGTLEERVDWLYDLCDTTRRGYVNEQDFVTLTKAMYELVGVHYIKERNIPMSLRRHIRHQFQKLDKNRNGKITRNEFVNGCLSDEHIVKSLETLKTIW